MSRNCENTDKILIHGLKFFAFHGVYDFEAEQGQEFFLDLELFTSLRKAGDSDELTDSIDYGLLYNKILEWQAEHRFQLLEALAKHLCQRIFSHDLRITAVKLRLRKPQAPVEGSIGSGKMDFVGVEIYRQRPQSSDLGSRTC